MFNADFTMIVDSLLLRLLPMMLITIDSVTIEVSVLNVNHLPLS